MFGLNLELPVPSDETWTSGRPLNLDINHINNDKQKCGVSVRQDGWICAQKGGGVKDGKGSKEFRKNSQIRKDSETFLEEGRNSKGIRQEGIQTSDRGKLSRKECGRNERCSELGKKEFGSKDFKGNSKGRIELGRYFKETWKV